MQKMNKKKKSKFQTTIIRFRPEVWAKREK